MKKTDKQSIHNETKERINKQSIQTNKRMSEQTNHMNQRRNR